jgi:hypothetical protein
MQTRSFTPEHSERIALRATLLPIGIKQDSTCRIQNPPPVQAALITAGPLAVNAILTPCASLPVLIATTPVSAAADHLARKRIEPEALV